MKQNKKSPTISRTIKIPSPKIHQLWTQISQIKNKIFLIQKKSNLIKKKGNKRNLNLIINQKNCEIWKRLMNKILKGNIKKLLNYINFI